MECALQLDNLANDLTVSLLMGRPTYKLERYMSLYFRVVQDV